MNADIYDDLDRCLAQIDEEHLRILSQRIGERLHTFRLRREQEKLRQFQVLDRAWFMHKNKRYTGTILKINRRTASLQLDDGSQWNVGSQGLNRLEKDDFIDVTVVDRDEKQTPQDVWKDLLRYLPEGNRRGK